MSSIIQEVMNYDPDTGILTWKLRSPETFNVKIESVANRWNGRFAGKEAFTATDRDGYKVGSVNGVKYFAHRLVWEIYYGSPPMGEIDHINLDKADNRISNLRVSTHGQNQRNKGRQSNNTSGYKGVHFNKCRGMWQALIKKNGKSHHIGYFQTAKSAHEAYCYMSEMMHEEYGRVA